MLGKFLEWFKFPALVRPFRFYDGETGQVIEIKTSPRYTKLIVGNKEFFFIRETGKYDGLGTMSLDVPQSNTDCTADHIN